MKYAVWFLRLLFAAWMIPAGINHFVTLVPQWMGFTPLSHEMIVALMDSHLFDLIKAVELVAGLGVLFGFYTPLSLLICLPVSFGIFYWDGPIEGWSSVSAWYGYATFLCNVLLCLAYFKNYQAMFTLRATAGFGRKLVLAGRILFGSGIAIFAANYLFLSLWSEPSGNEELAKQLMTSLINSRLIEVVMVFQLIAGLFIVAGICVPAALCLQINISICAFYWSVILNHQPLTASITFIAFAVNALLMVAYLHYYQGVLEKRALAFRETGMKSYDALFVNPFGEVSRAVFVPASIVLLAAMVFFKVFVAADIGLFCIIVLLYPVIVLLARRLRDMSIPQWLALTPLILVLACLGIQVEFFALSKQAYSLLSWIAFGGFGACALLGCVKAEAN